MSKEKAKEKEIHLTRRQFGQVLLAGIALPEQGLSLLSKLRLDQSPQLQVAEIDGSRYRLDWQPAFNLIDENKALSPEQAAVWERAKENLGKMATGYEPVFKWASNLVELNEQREKDPTKVSTKALAREVFLGNIPPMLVPVEGIIPFYYLHDYMIVIHSQITEILQKIKSLKLEENPLGANWLTINLVEFLEKEAKSVTPSPSFLENYGDEKVQYVDGVAIVPDASIVMSEEGKQAFKVDEVEVRDFIKDYPYFEKQGLKTLVILVSKKYGELDKKLSESMMGKGGKFFATRGGDNKFMGVIVLNMDTLSEVEDQNHHPKRLNWHHEKRHWANIFSNLNLAFVLPPELVLDRYAADLQIMANKDWGPGGIGIGFDIFSSKPSYRGNSQFVRHQYNIRTTPFVGTSLEYPANLIFTYPGKDKNVQNDLCLHLKSQPVGIEQFVQRAQQRVLNNWSIGGPDSSEIADVGGVNLSFAREETTNTSEGETKEGGQINYKNFRDFIDAYRPELERRANAGELLARILLVAIEEYGVGAFENFHMFGKIVNSEGKRLIPTPGSDSEETWQRYTEEFLPTGIIYDWVFNKTGRIYQIFGTEKANNILRHFIDTRSLAILEFDAESGGYFHYYGPRLEESDKCPQKTGWEHLAYLLKIAS